VGFVVDKVALGHVFSKHFGFPCQSSFHQLLHNHPRLSSGTGTIGQKWPQYSFKKIQPEKRVYEQVVLHLSLKYLNSTFFL
jgi:hypothetical protein